MSRVPVGKVLLRNVIRHTDAHNKIQEESEMWKLRVMEKQVPQPAQIHQTRGHMHCDRIEADSRDRSRSHNRTSAEDERESRYWTRKLYEFEAKDPDRWGHSGFKELYPEEFNSDEEKRKKKSSISKHLKKSSKKKKKRKEEKRKKVEEQSSDDISDDSDNDRSQQRRKRTKRKHKWKKSERGREEVSRSANSKMDGGRGNRTSSHKKRHRDSHKSSDSGLESIKRRKNGKSTKEEESGHHSEN